ncbi:MAG: ComEC/Rec2 family competence protein [Hyphomicrobiales bacterium]
MSEAVERVGARTEAFPRISLAAFVARCLAEQEGRFFLWSPVILIAGVWSYFALPIEPTVWIFALALVGFGWLAFAVIRGRGGLAVKIGCIFLLGFSLARIRTEIVASPAITAPTGEVHLAGIIERIERKSPRSGVVMLRITSLDGAGAPTRPERVRLSVSGSQVSELAPGLPISTRASLAPLPSPAMPGGFDYGRMLWFEGVGATGRAFGQIERSASAPDLRYWPAAALAALRASMNDRIAAVLPPDRAAFAEALITGERASLPRTVIESLQVSGLYHIISISGLHMSLVAGGIFWLVRAFLALSPTLAIHHPIKKWAAVAALLAGLFYMLLAGAEVATERSYIMIAIMLFAILVDRPALSMRNLAIAALIIVTMFPESALSASLQMSFLAVMGLLALHESLSEAHDRDAPSLPSPWLRTARYFWRAFTAMALTTLVAGGLSSIAAVYHFGRLAPYSLLANLLALPVVSLVVMPMALASVLLMPLGLEGLPLHAMNSGITLVLDISDWVSGLPGAAGRLPAIPLLSALFLSAGAVMLCLFKGPLRLVALPAFAAGIAAAPFAAHPDILIERRAANVAIRTDDGMLVPSGARRGKFAVETWLRTDGDSASAMMAAKRPGWTCSGDECRARIGTRRVLYAHEGKQPVTALSCDTDILIADFPLRGRCRNVPVRIDRFDVWRHGAHALYIHADLVGMETARGEQGRRPWTIRPTPRNRPWTATGTTTR